MKLAGRISCVSASLTLAMDAKTKDLAAKGVDVCNFTVGEPDFETPPHIREAAKQALDAGRTRYGPAAGEPGLRDAIAAKLRRDSGLGYKRENIVVCNGGKQALFNCLQIISGPGDEVIIPAPYWLSYLEMVKLAGATPVIINTTPRSRFKLSPQRLEAAITPRTRAIMLNSPSNPTGMVYSKQELEELARVIVKHDLLVISDEIYEKLVYTGSHTSIASLGGAIFERTVVCNGFSKAYAMTGWRIGYLAGSKELIDAVTSMQSHSTSNVCTFAQYGAIAALEGDQSFLDRMRDAFAKRLDLMHALVNGIPKLSCHRSEGAFYLFVDISKTGMDSMQFSQKLLDDHHVSAAPGIAFGDDTHVRFSYATSEAAIIKGMERVKKFVQ